MQAKVEGSELVLRIPMIPNPQPSASGKTLIVCTTNGSVKLDGVQVNGQPLIIGLNAYVKR